MHSICDGITMAKKKAPEPTPPEERVTVLNLKGSPHERASLQRLSRITGVPASEIARRGMALWATQRGIKALPEEWSGA